MKYEVPRYIFLLLVFIVIILLYILSNNNKANTNDVTEYDSEDYIYVTLRINMPLGYSEIDNLFENPMSEYLEKNNIGELTGDGYPLDEIFGPYATDLEFDIKNKKLKDFKNMLKDYQFPKGSYLLVDSEEQELPNEITNLEGLRLYSNNLNNTQIEEFYNKLSEYIKENYEYKTIINASSKNYLYYYSKNKDELKKKINDFIDNNSYSGKIIIEDMPLQLIEQ